LARPLPEVTVDALAEAAPLAAGAEPALVIGPAARTGAASDPDFAAAATVAAGAALLDCGVADAADTGVELAGAAAEPVESKSVIAGLKTAPCPSCEVAPAGSVVAALDVPVATSGGLVAGAPAAGEEPVLAAAPMAGVASSEPPSPASSRAEGRTGAPFAGGAWISTGVPAGATTGAAAAGGAPLPEGGNGSPLGLPLPDFAEASFLPALAEARSSARAKSRAWVVLGDGSAALTAFCAPA
jgi:hypothetical protein